MILSLCGILFYLFTFCTFFPKSFPCFKCFTSSVILKSIESDWAIILKTGQSSRKFHFNPLFAASLEKRMICCAHPVQELAPSVTSQRGDSLSCVCVCWAFLIERDGDTIFSVVYRTKLIDQ